MGDIDKMLDQAGAQYKAEPQSSGGGVSESHAPKANDDWKVWEQGSQSAAQPKTYTARNGSVHQTIPEGTEIMGSPILPSGAAIPSAVGYGASKLGEYLGFPDWANTTAGLVAGGLTGAGSSLASKFRTLSPEKAEGLTRSVVGSIPIVGKWANAAREAFAPETPVAPEPFRPNPAIASKTRFGGPMDTGGGSSYPGVGMSGAPVIENEPQIWKPNKPNPSIAAKIKYGGPSDASGGPAYSRVGMSGAPPAPEVSEGIAPAPSYTGPNRVNPNIARNLRFTPGGSSDAGRPAGRVAIKPSIPPQGAAVAPVSSAPATAPIASPAAADSGDLAPLLERSIQNANAAKTPIRENIRRR